MNLPDAPDDAPITKPEDLELDLVTSGNGSGRITSSPEGIDCGSTCMGSFEDGTMVTLTAEPDASSLFTGWGGACSGTSPVCEVTISAATSVTATFTLKTYTVTVTKAGAGTGTVAGNGINCGTGAGCSVTVDHGTAISLTATPGALSVFAGWGGACTGTSTCDLTITDDTDINAAFSLDELALIVTKVGAGTVTSNPSGINCGGTCTFVFTANQMVTLTAAPAASSTFTGWTGAGCSGTGSCTVTMDMAKAVTATFTLKRYTLDVNKTGSTGTGTVTSMPSGIACGGNCSAMYDHGTAITLTPTPTPGTSSFTGWSGGCTGSGACVVTLTAPTTVTAHFALNSYALTSSVTGMGTITSTPAGVTCPGDCSHNYTHGTAVSFSQMAAPGYTFTGWGGDCSGTGACSVTMTAAKNVTATFTINSYDLDVSITGMGTVTAAPQIACPGACQGTYTHGTPVTLTRSAATGYTFAGWGGDCSGTGPCNVTMDAAKNVTATFTLNKYALTASFGPGTGTGTISATGIGCPGDCTENFNHGEVVVVTQMPDADSNFSGWGGACSGMTTCSVTMDGVKNVIATYTLKNYDLMVSIVGSGTVSGTQIGCPGDCTGTYPHGTSVPLTQSAGSGYRFTGWTGGCTGMAGCSVSMDMPKTVTATFTQIFRLNVTIAGSTGTVTSTPAGISCGSNCSEDYLTGTSVLLTAAGTGGATFASWSGAPGCGTSMTCSVTMDQLRNVTATFNPPTFALNAAFAGDGFGTITAGTFINCGNGSLGGSDCSETLTQNSMVTLIAAPTTTVASAASIFRGWSGCTTASGTTCNVTMDAAHTVTASFALSPNVMFVTSQAVSIDTLASGGQGWVVKADAECARMAGASNRGIVGEGPHQNMKWRAWLSGKDQFAGNVHAVTRMAGASGWERVDGRPFLNKVTDIDDDAIIYPPRINENGADVGTDVLVWTGTNNQGVYSGLACESAASGLSWGTTQGRGTQGLASANSQQFTDLANTPFGDTCGVSRRLYCFGVDRQAAVTVNRSRGRLAFTTEGTFRATATGGANNMGGLEAADEMCQNEAMAISGVNPRAFKALLSTTTASAISRFATHPSDEPWVRVGDLQPITNRESDLRNPQSPVTTMLVAPNVTATGQRLGYVEIWTGASRPSAAAPNLSASCRDWTDGDGTKSTAGLGFDTGISTYWFGAFSNNVGCSKSRHLVCLENLQ